MSSVLFCECTDLCQWGTDIKYWLANSLPMGYQNQSTAWLLGGDNITFTGNGYGTLHGNGQVWYDFAGGTSNYPRRPHALTISNTTNSFFSGLRFIQSQMWTLTVIHSKNVLLQDVFVNNLKDDGGTTINTDGADTIYANNITFDRWEVHNGDDAISPKANSTNITVTNSIFYRGTGLALGSIGQYKGVFETIENFKAENITCVGTTHALYMKTWTGQQVGYPPNGGGGGLGCMFSSPSTFILTFDRYQIRSPQQLHPRQGSKYTHLHISMYDFLWCGRRL